MESPVSALWLCGVAHLSQMLHQIKIQADFHLYSVFLHIAPRIVFLLLFVVCFMIITSYQSTTTYMKLNVPGLNDKNATFRAWRGWWSRDGTAVLNVTVFFFFFSFFKYNIWWCFNIFFLLKRSEYVYNQGNLWVTQEQRK